MALSVCVALATTRSVARYSASCLSLRSCFSTETRSIPGSRRGHAPTDRLRLEPPCRGGDRDQSRGPREHLYKSTATGKKVLEFMPRAAELRRTETAIKRFSIKAEGPEQPVATLSGGNQQKVAVARWMEANVDLLILEEPRLALTLDRRQRFTIYSSSARERHGGPADLLISRRSSVFCFSPSSRSILCRKGPQRSHGSFHDPRYRYFAAPAGISGSVSYQLSR